MRTNLIPAVQNEIVVYEPNDLVRLVVRVQDDSVWLTQAQMCELFQRDVSVVSRHIKNEIVSSARGNKLKATDIALFNKQYGGLTIKQTFPRPLSRHRRQAFLSGRRVAEGLGLEVLRLHAA